MTSKNDMGRTCSTCGARSADRTSVGKPEGRNQLEDSGVRWRIVLKWICEKWDGDMDWIDLAQNRDRWRAVVNAAMNLRVT